MEKIPIRVSVLFPHKKMRKVSSNRTLSVLEKKLAIIEKFYLHRAYLLNTITTKADFDASTQFTDGSQIIIYNHRNNLKVGHPKF